MRNFTNWENYERVLPQKLSILVHFYWTPPCFQHSTPPPPSLPLCPCLYPLARSLFLSLSPPTDHPIFPTLTEHTLEVEENENHLRSALVEARESLSEVIIADLADYRHKRVMGLAGMFGDHMLTSETSAMYYITPSLSLPFPSLFFFSAQLSGASPSLSHSLFLYLLSLHMGNIMPTTLFTTHVTVWNRGNLL